MTSASLVYIDEMAQVQHKKAPKALTYTLLHEDENHLVVDKPAGLGCLHDRRDMGRPCLIELLKEKYPEASLAHRIDIETSGIVLVALGSENLKLLSKQFEERSIEKEYLTFVSSYVGFDETVVERPVGPILQKGHTTMRRKGKASITRFVKERSYKGYCKLRCFPHTGRTHQIRIHLSDMGMPIVGDIKYGGTLPYLSKIKRGYVRSKKRSDQEETPLIQRVALHAHQLTYQIPHSEERLTITSPEPKDFQKFTEKLEKFAS